MPSVVAVLAGNTVGELREIKELSVPSNCREFILVSGLTEVCCNELSKLLIYYILIISV